MRTQLCFMLFLLITVAARTEPETEDPLCTICERVKESIEKSTDTKTGTVFVYITLLKTFCQRISQEGLKDRCTAIVARGESLIAAASKQTAGLCDPVCKQTTSQMQLFKEKVLSEVLADSAQDPMSNSLNCLYCKLLFKLTWSRLKLDSVVKSAKEIMLEVCVEAKLISKGDCKKAVSEATERIGISDAENFCTLAGFCDATSALYTT
eukprot:g65.t1